MKKLKDLGSLIAIILMLCTIVGLLTSLCSTLFPEKEITPYTVTYKAVRDSRIERIHEDLWLKDGEYPETYVPGEKLEVSDLQEYIFPSEREEYRFEGWYLDEKCKTKFTGNTEGLDGNITLYAKIRVCLWTKFY